MGFMVSKGNTIPVGFSRGSVLFPSFGSDSFLTLLDPKRIEVPDFELQGA